MLGFTLPDAPFGVGDGVPFGPAGVGENAGDGAGEDDIAGLGLAVGLFGTVSLVHAAASAAAEINIAGKKTLVFIVFSLMSS